MHRILALSFILFFAFSFSSAESIVPAPTLKPNLAAMALRDPPLSEPPAPRKKPRRLHRSQVVSRRDINILRDAFYQAERGNWEDVYLQQERATDEDVRLLIFWLRAISEDAPIEFKEISYLLNKTENWPKREYIRNRGETLIDDSNLTIGQKLAWLKSEGGPSTGRGLLALARTYKSLGWENDANIAIREAWRTKWLSTETRDTIKGEFGLALTRDDHHARADFLIWTNQHAEAIELRPFLHRSWRNLIDTRIALAKNSKDVNKRLASISNHLKRDLGLLFDRARWKKRNGEFSDATRILLEIDSVPFLLDAKYKLWQEQRNAIRRNLNEGRYGDAYRLAIRHGFSSGINFARAEWIAGWIALKHFGNGGLALSHFSKLEASVTAPISKARALYWMGRSYELMDKEEGAKRAYAKAAKYPLVFYGQLAASKLGDYQLSLDLAPEPTPEEAEEFGLHPLVRVMKLVGESADHETFLSFSYELDDLLTTPQDFLLLADFVESYNQPGAAVRGAKVALFKGILPTQSAYPKIQNLPEELLHIEHALILALARQESEMNPKAISKADARGLMQFLPSTAQTEAIKRSIEYRESWLTDRPTFNLRLSALHLDTLLEQFNGSYVLTIAAYNAGAKNVEEWIASYGDPRKADVDVIDWIESIPFYETRNYVQRVLESLQVYRHILAGEPTQILIEQDLNSIEFRELLQAVKVTP